MDSIVGQHDPDHGTILEAEIDCRRIDVRIRSERIGEIGFLRTESGVVRAGERWCGGGRAGEPGAAGSSDGVARASGESGRRDG